MTNIFRSLAIFSLALLGINLILGLNIGDYNGQIDRLFLAAEQLKAELNPEVKEQLATNLSKEQNQWNEISSRAGTHMVLGTFAAICTVLASCVCLTYFVGTSRWCKEVTEAYRFDPELADQSAKKKRLAFQLAVGTMTAMMLLVALGSLAASPSDFLRAWSSQMVTPHLILSFVATTFVGFAFLKQMQLVSENYQIIRQLSDQVQIKRKEKSLNKDSTHP